MAGQGGMQRAAGHREDSWNDSARYRIAGARVWDVNPLALSGLLLVLGWMAPARALTVAEACPDRRIAASAVTTQGDVRAFVECARSYLTHAGTAEAYRAFHNDRYWKSGSIYLVVVELIPDGDKARVFLHAGFPEREGAPTGREADQFGDDFSSEGVRVVQANGSGFWYYAFRNPLTGSVEPKVSYAIGIDWNGVPSLILSGIYRRDLPATCNPSEVSAETVTSLRSLERLEEFVRCAAIELEERGPLAMDELGSHARWTDGSTYLYVMDTAGTQLLSGSRFRVNGVAPHEWGGRPGPSDQFGGRDTLGIAEAFGESYVYYRSYDPRTGSRRDRVGFVKRVVAQGMPLFVGGGYYSDSHGPARPRLGGGPPPILDSVVGPSVATSNRTCEDNHVTAETVQSREDLRAFVRCAKEYVEAHGTAESHRAFHHDERWRSAQPSRPWQMGQVYVFVDGLAPSGDLATAYVYPPRPSREGSVWGRTVDWYGTDVFADQFRILSAREDGWSHNAFINAWARRVDPKLSYIVRTEWDGNPAMIGAGLYELDLPGTCARSEVSATALETAPSDRLLQAFVRCAAEVVKSSGLFAAPILETDPRWNSGSVYVFGVNATNEAIEFSGNAASFDVSGRITELLFGGRDVVGVANSFGEAFWYYQFEDPATAQAATKVAFVKRVMVQGIPILVGSGYYPSDR